MADRTLMLMNWDELGNDDDQFFESFDQMSAAMAMDMDSSGSDDDDDEDYDDSRMSFASCYSAPPEEFRGLIASAATPVSTATTFDDYNIWLAEPESISIEERRKRLLKGMGLGGAPSIKAIKSLRARSIRIASKRHGAEIVKQLKQSEQTQPQPQGPQQQPAPSPAPTLLVRSKSDASVASSSLLAQRRMKDLLGVQSKHQLLRTASGFGHSFNSPLKGKHGKFFLIKNLDSGKHFIVNEFDDDGTWNRVSDLQTGKELTREEFEKSQAYSPIVKDLVNPENVFRDLGVAVKKVSINLQNLNPIIGKSLKYSKRRGAAWLKNIKGLIGDKENSTSPLSEQRSQSPWTKVHQRGKPYKELTGLYMAQEIQAHQGSIWTIKFSLDTHYLASAGEDRLIHIWEVIDSEPVSLLESKTPEEGSTTSSCSLTPTNSMGGGNQQQDRSLTLEDVMPLEKKKKKGKMSTSDRKGFVQDYVMMPDTVFSLSEKPVCTLEGHRDDILDLSWSSSQHLLSSSMDKTVRLWNMESKTCLKVFVHNDYVTCVQFNPVDDKYFISGSLDGKVRLWSVPDRHVENWTDLNEMVTATCYTPDGQGAFVGSHKGSCRLFDTTDSKLDQKGQIDIQVKKKTPGKKITGFEFAPNNPSEVLVSSADSRIRILDGLDIVQKFRGFRNTNSQISASFTADGKYIISASEDSQIYVWKRDETKNAAAGKNKVALTNSSYEQFHCKDVSVAIAWPDCTKYEPPIVPLQSRRQSKRSNLPPLPPSGASNSNQEDSINNSGRRNSPSLPGKNSIVDRSDSEISASDSFSSSSSSVKYGDSHSSSASLSSVDGGSSNGHNCIQATAWGLVIVAAGLGGELKVYQNFGLPIRFSRQANLFRDHTAVLKDKGSHSFTG